MVVSLWELRSDHNWKDAASSTKGITQITVQTIYVKGKANTCMIYYVVKACILYIFFFTKWWPFKNYEKCFLLYLKSFFYSLDIQIFVFPSSPLFLPVGHCFAGWSKINLQVYDFTNCLNKNLITHFVWYLQKEKRCGIETLSIDRELNKEQCYGKCY